MPEFYMIFARKIFFPNFGGQLPPSAPPSPTLRHAILWRIQRRCAGQENHLRTELHAGHNLVVSQRVISTGNCVIDSSSCRTESSALFYVEILLGQQTEVEVCRQNSLSHRQR